LLIFSVLQDKITTLINNFKNILKKIYIILRLKKQLAINLTENFKTREVSLNTL